MSASNDTPQLSVVVAIVSDTTTARCGTAHLERSLTALARQIEPPSLEIIVPFHRGVDGIERLRTAFPKVNFLPVELQTYTGRGGSREHHDELRARGLEAARGEIVALIEDHGCPDPEWSSRQVRMHSKGFAAWGGAIENGIDRALNWAVYFCDFGRYQNPVPEGESSFASDANVSYKRDALQAVRSVWQKMFHEPAVNFALRQRGCKLGLSPDLVVYQSREDLRLSDALRERWVWGRSYAAARSAQVSAGRRMLYAALAPALPAVLLLRMGANVASKKRCIGAFLKALPLTALLTVSWSSGECAGYITRRAT
jgi:hypothetical protein